MGKTTILDALAIAAGVWLIDYPDITLSSSERDILPHEIRAEMLVQMEAQDMGN